MLPETFQAAVVTVLVVLPGALYTWGTERAVGHWGVGLADRVLRFAGISACFHVVLAPLTYHSYRFYFGRGGLGGDLPLALWLALLGYVFVPLLAGLAVGHGLRRELPWARLVAGRNRAPRAWDVLFGLDRSGYVRLKVRDSDRADDGPRWLAGWYGLAKGAGRTISSYGARYPAPQDLYLAMTFVCDRQTGKLVIQDGSLIVSGEGLLIRWEEVLYLYFMLTGGATIET